MIELSVIVYLNGLFMSEGVVSFIVGSPMLIFSDTTNNSAPLWTITATPSNPKWEATITSYYSALNSYSDSKIGNYVSNVTVTMTLTDSIDLSGYSNPRFSFQTKFDVESNCYNNQVEISINNG